MRQHTLLRLLVTILVFLTPVVTSAAPRKGDGDMPPAAREEYDRARSLFKAGDFKGCVEALERAQKIAPDPRFFWNSAACEKKLGHNARAMRYVERYLAAGATSLGEQEKKEATAFLDAANAYVARVTVVANIEGVEVYVDDELLGTTPFARPIVVDEGEHVVRYLRAGYKSKESREKALGGAELRWAVELVANEPAQARPPAAPPPPKKEEPTPLRWGPILLGGVGVVVAAVGGVLVVTTLSEASTIERECGTTCPPSRWEGDRDRQIVGDVMLASGGAMVVGAAVWWFLKPTTSAQRAFWVEPGLGNVALGGTFR